MSTLSTRLRVYASLCTGLALDGQWQKLEPIRILMGDEVSKKTSQAFRAAVNHIAGRLDESKECFYYGIRTLFELERRGRTTL